MTKQSQSLHNELTIETWKEELSRAKQYKEATQKRKKEKLVQKQVDVIKKKTAVGRLHIEP